MKDSLKLGLEVRRKLTVDKARTIDFLGEELRVYATPEFVRDIEQTCRDFLLEHADAGEDSVGIGIEITHGAATPLGGTVEIAAKVAKIEGRQVIFEIVARDESDEIGRGKHGRFMVEVEKLRQRVAAKLGKAS